MNRLCELADGNNILSPFLSKQLESYNIDIIFRVNSPKEKSASQTFTVSGQMRLYKFGILVILFSHWCALMWMYIGCGVGQDGSSCNPQGWAVEEGIQAESHYVKYLWALYWCVTTISSVGFEGLFYNKRLPLPSFPLHCFSI